MDKEASEEKAKAGQALPRSEPIYPPRRRRAELHSAAGRLVLILKLTPILLLVLLLVWLLNGGDPVQLYGDYRAARNGCSLHPSEGYYVWVHHDGDLASLVSHVADLRSSHLPAICGAITYLNGAYVVLVGPFPKLEDAREARSKIAEGRYFLCHIGAQGKFDFEFE
jgi:hypothetical protein